MRIIFRSLVVGACKGVWLKTISCFCSFTPSCKKEPVRFLIGRRLKAVTALLYGCRLYNPESPTNLRAILLEFEPVPHLESKRSRIWELGFIFGSIINRLQ